MGFREFAGEREEQTRCKRVSGEQQAMGLTTFVISITGQGNIGVPSHMFKTRVGHKHIFYVSFFTWWTGGVVCQRFFVRGSCVLTLFDVFQGFACLTHNHINLNAFLADKN